MRKNKDFIDQNSCRVYSFDSNKEDKLYVENIFAEIIRRCPNLQISSIRSNYDISYLLSKLYEIEDQLTHLKYDRNWIDLECNNIVTDFKLASVLVDLWFNFEENRFVFYQLPGYNENDDLSNLVLDDRTNIIKRTKAYFVQGNGLSDYIDFFKSDELKFDIF
ncbi:hypothetical protein [Sphingobacterium spiritivorum]|uniref:hypothetical protein n=1 Tax=Sphingobacterium spiritivorum TaxID=258 RepID=UPI00191AFF23|nr:hypothetical protein [Sphingobacterium spiritivorum]QQT28238.1 hypothetical protein I6J02_10505 [Sphingobacterium spiritivorum]